MHLHLGSGNDKITMAIYVRTREDWKIVIQFLFQDCGGIILAVSPTMSSEAAEHVRWETVPADQNTWMSSQVDTESNTFILENTTFADRAHLLFQLVHDESQDKEQDNGNCQCHTQAIHKERGDFARTSYIQSRENISHVHFTYLRIYTKCE